MQQLLQKIFTGERALFHSADLDIRDSVFEDGESPLKESRNLSLSSCIFQWKYPLWYCKDVRMDSCTLLETARSGIWYTDAISIRNSTIDAQKTFRRSRGIRLENVVMQNASETLWNCSDIRFSNVQAKGDYFAMNSSDIVIDTFSLSGNYAFDGGKNIEIRNARLISKDAFWNCENVVVYDSLIIGEYLGWNSKNITFVNCTIQSLQGMCYMDNVVLKNCSLIQTSLAFEFSTVDAQINTAVDSIKNPYGGRICAKQIGELLWDDTLVDPEKTTILTEEDDEI